MADRNALVDALVGLRDFVGDPPRWGARCAVPAIATDPPNVLLGEKVQQMCSVSFPVAMPLTIRWGYWKPAPFAIPGLTLPEGGGGRFRPMTSTGGISHHDAFRVLIEWTMPGGVAMRQWIGPNAPVSLTAQNLVASLYRMRRTTLDVECKLLVGLGHHDVTLAQKCVNSTVTTPNSVGAVVTQLVGSNWARRGGWVALNGEAGAAAPHTSFIGFSELAAVGIRLRFDDPNAPNWVPIPVDWCGPVWALGPDDGPPDAQFTVVEYWVQPPEMNPWAATP